MEQAPISGLAAVAVVIALLGALCTEAAKKLVANVHPPIVNLGSCLLVAIVLAAILPRVFNELPHDLGSWLTLGGSGAGIGGAAHFSLIKRRDDVL